MPKQQQLAALAKAETALHLATVRQRKDPHNDTFRREQAQLQTEVQILRRQLFGQENR